MSRRSARGWLAAGSALAVVAAALVLPSAGARVAGAADEDYDVRFLATGLMPVTVTLPAGSTVRWTNETAFSHNTAHRPEPGAPQLWNSPLIQPNGGVYTRTFSAPGTYAYYDLFDPNNPAYAGWVVVTGVGLETPTSTTAPTATDVPPTSTSPPPTATPPPPTATSGPPTATPTVGPSATPGPTQAPGYAVGILRNMRAGCAPANLMVQDCAGTLQPVRSDYDLRAYYDRNVRIDGFRTGCGLGGETYLWLSTIQPWASGCASPTPLPKPTQSPQSNLALRAPVTASMNLPGSEKEHAVDGDPNSVWYSSGSPAWIYVDLGQDRTFNEVTLKWGTPFAKRFGIYVWEGGQWNGVYYTPSDRGGGDETISLPRIYARVVLLYLTESSDPLGGFALREMEIRGRETPNVAIGGEVHVSTEQSCCPGWMAIDQDYRTGWASRSNRDDPPDRKPWIRLILPGPQDIAEIRMYWSQNFFPWEYWIVFYNGTRSIPAYARVTGGGLIKVSPPSPIRATALLIYSEVVSSVDGVAFVALSELELYEPAFVQGGRGGAARNSENVRVQWMPPRRSIGLDPIGPGLLADLGQARTPGSGGASALGRPVLPAGLLAAPAAPSFPRLPDSVPAPVW